MCQWGVPYYQNTAMALHQKCLLDKCFIILKDILNGDFRPYTLDIQNLWRLPNVILYNFVAQGAAESLKF